ncbi:MAG: DNA alkylation repair protein [Chloroflexi bacterium]|nr:DNA alkylation repair protein [Chloroflexota bacterium]
MTSEVSRAAAAFVTGHLPAARALGEELADLVTVPIQFVERLDTGLATLADPPYAIEQERVAPGSGPVHGVRWPLLHALERALTPALEETSPSLLIDLAGRLVDAERRETRLVAHACLRVTLGDEPERSWQLLRRMARAADDWISVDTLAETLAQGILREPFRWAELEQLVYSDRPMERRLVGATLARIPYALPRSDRRRLDPGPVLALIGQLMGEVDAQVRAALSWALREWARDHAGAVESFLTAQATVAVDTRDGARAWVIRDSLAHLPGPAADRLRARVAGIRRRPGAPSTSTAAGIAAAFGLSALTDQVVASQGDRYARSQP